mgnify:CR=1 FL=1
MRLIELLGYFNASEQTREFGACSHRITYICQCDALLHSWSEARGELLRHRNFVIYNSEFYAGSEHRAETPARPRARPSCPTNSPGRRRCRRESRGMSCRADSRLLRISRFTSGEVSRRVAMSQNFQVLGS